MPKDERRPGQSLRTLPPDIVGTTSAARLISFLKTLPPDSPIGTSVTQSGQEWYLSLNLSDLCREPSGTERI
jgi:hypothetical protein